MNGRRLDRRRSWTLLVVVALAFGAAGCRSEASAHAVQVTEAAATGDVDALVRDAQAKAAAGKRRVVVYVGATWCEPCRRFHEAAARGELDAVLPDVTLLTFDLDRDRARLTAAGYVSKLIPLFALPGPGGRSSGRQIEGSIKGDGAVAELTPRLRELLGP